MFFLYGDFTRCGRIKSTAPELRDIFHEFCNICLKIFCEAERWEGYLIQDRVQWRALMALASQSVQVPIPTTSGK
jgi:hypothetical protein